MREVATVMAGAANGIALAAPAHADSIHRDGTYLVPSEIKPGTYCPQ